jgi:hypothetical protein
MGCRVYTEYVNGTWNDYMCTGGRRRLWESQERRRAAKGGTCEGSGRPDVNGGSRGVAGCELTLELPRAMSSITIRRGNGSRARSVPALATVAPAPPQASTAQA